MKKLSREILSACIVGALCACVAKGDGFRIEDGKVVVDSPFDLEIGSPEYAKALGNGVKSHKDVRKDPKTGETVTNWYHSGEAHFAQPYFGAKNAWLSFSGEDKALSRAGLSIGKDGKGFGGALAFDISSADKLARVIGNGFFLYHPIQDLVNLKYIQVISAGLDRVPVDEVRRRGLARVAVLSSVQFDHIREARRCDKEIFIHHIFSKPEQLDELAAMGNAGLSYNYKDLSNVPDGLVAGVHAKGVKMCLRAGDTPDAVARMVALGLDYIPTNVTVPI